MRKHKFVKVFSYLLIATGLFLVALPYINQLHIENRVEKNNAVADELSAEQMKTNLSSETTFDFDSIDDLSISGTLLSPEYIDQNLIIGRLYIPKIEANLTIFNGVSNDILNAGVGTMQPDLHMGQGNFSIAGHYSKDKNTLFGDLVSVELGDEIYLTDNETVYEYEVYETRIVAPTEVEWIKQEVAEKHGKAIVSLMNCYYVSGENSGNRYFVFGELVDVYSKEASPLAKK